jgi:hypothetical protein
VARAACCCACRLFRAHHQDGPRVADELVHAHREARLLPLWVRLRRRDLDQIGLSRGRRPGQGGSTTATRGRGYRRTSRRSARRASCVSKRSASGADQLRPDGAAQRERPPASGARATSAPWSRRLPGRPAWAGPVPARSGSRFAASSHPTTGSSASHQSRRLSRWRAGVSRRSRGKPARDRRQRRRGASRRRDRWRFGGTARGLGSAAGRMRTSRRMRSRRAYATTLAQGSSGRGHGRAVYR